VSFKGEALQRTRDAMKTLARLHPNYQPDVARYIARDPAWTARARLDLARLARQSEARNVLLVCHNRGGGTERHLLEENERLVSRGGACSSCARPPSKGRWPCCTRVCSVCTTWRRCRWMRWIC
jgi:hypothetical protein